MKLFLQSYIILTSLCNKIPFKSIVNHYVFKFYVVNASAVPIGSPLNHISYLYL